MSIGPVVEEKSCHKLNMNDKEKRSIKTYLKGNFRSVKSVHDSHLASIEIATPEVSLKMFSE